MTPIARAFLATSILALSGTAFAADTMSDMGHMGKDSMAQEHMGKEHMGKKNHKAQGMMDKKESMKKAPMKMDHMDKGMDKSMGMDKDKMDKNAMPQ